MHLTRLAILIIFLSPLAQASTLTSKIAHCAQYSDSLERLVCYDKLAASLKVQIVKAPAAQIPEGKSIENEKPIDLPHKVEPNHDKVSSATTAAVAKTKVVKVKPIEPGQKSKQQNEAVAQFGNEKKQQAEKEIKEIQAIVSQVSKTAFGKYIISLENNQKWQQTDSNRLTIKPGQKVMIERGFFGSFFMGVEGMNKRIRVKRVK